jgi:hypothetical protein
MFPSKPSRQQSSGMIHPVQPWLEKPRVGTARDGTIPPLRRRLLNLPTLLSLHGLLAAVAGACLLLLLVVAVLAVRGFWYTESLSYECYSRQGFDHSLSVTWRRGAVTLRYNTGSPPRAPVLERHVERTVEPLNPKSLQNHLIAIRQLGAREWAGFLYWSDARPGNVGRTSTALWVPYWFVLLSLALVAAGFGLVSRGARRRYRAGRGLCRQCGYDLRATPDRCPECGAAAGPAGAA